MKSTFRILLLALIPLVVAACTASAPLATPTSTGLMPHSDRPDILAMQRGEGKDICSRFDKPVETAFEPGQGSALAVFPGEHIRGPEDAKVTILVYTDFTCDKCKQLTASLDQLLADNPDTRIVVRVLPAGDTAVKAGEAAEAAAKIGGEDAFWKMHDALFEHQADWLDLTGDDLDAKFAGYATDIGLDGEALVEEMPTFKEAMVFAPDGAKALNVTSTPSLIIDDLPVLDAPTDVRTLELVLQIHRLQRKYPEPPPMTIDPAKDYVAWIVTEHGDIAIDLYADLAPETVNNFAYLACAGFYDDITWHRVLPGFMAQTGDPSGTGFGGPGYTIHDEFAGSALAFDGPGWLSMAHTSQPNSAGSQFFITYAQAEHLSGQFTIFGKVVTGQDVLAKITPRDPSQSSSELPAGDKLVTVIVREVE